MSNQQIVYIVDDDEGVRDGFGLLMDTVNQPYEVFESGVEFLEAYHPDMRGCLVLDIRMPRMSGLELQEKLKERESLLPVIFITGHGDIPMAVDAMRRGALDFIRKPFREQSLLDRINEALDIEAGKRKFLDDRQQALVKLKSLSERERQVFELVASGQMNKAIAMDLNISERTVEAHRAQIMKKLNIRTLAQLVRIKIDAELIEASE
ncbi:MAG: response regulator [Burkholderiales bacterium]|nr:response regulator [Burkholderiales bacterium]